MRRRSESCNCLDVTNETRQLRRTNSLGHLTELVQWRGEDYDVYNDIVEYFDIQECELSNHIRYLDIRPCTIFDVDVYIGTRASIGKCKNYTRAYMLPSPVDIMCNSLGNLLRLRYLMIDAKCNMSIGILNRLTRLRSLSLYRIRLLSDDTSNTLLLPKLRSLTMVECELETGNTYDLIKTLNTHNPDIQSINICRMAGEDIHDLQCIPTIDEDRQLPIHNMHLLEYLRLDMCYLNAYISDECMAKLVDSIHIMKITRSLLTRRPPHYSDSDRRLYSIATRRLYINTIEVEYYDLYIVTVPITPVL